LSSKNTISIDDLKEYKILLVTGIANPAPLTQFLKEKKIILVPDFLANAGGVTVSYFEWVQNRQQFYWSAKEVDDKLHAIIIDATNNVYAVSQKENITLREAGFRIAVERVGKATALRGHK
jgi:glutamate dehydrogenase/leucine dehydrogenase